MDLSNREIELLMNWAHIVHRTMLENWPPIHIPPRETQPSKPEAMRQIEKLYEKLENEYNSRSQRKLFSEPWDGRDD